MGTSVVVLSVWLRQAHPRARWRFEQYEKNIGAPDPTVVAGQYGESFVFAGPQGAQVVKRDDFLKALPRRQEFFKASGLRSSGIQRLEEARIDNSCVMVKAYGDVPSPVEIQRRLG